MSAARQTFTRPQGGFMVIRRTVRIGVYVATVGLTAQLAATCAWGQQLYIYPQRGQSFDQQAVDKAECQRWATEQTGYNPATPPPPPMAAAPQGGMFRGAFGGAALGAIGGAIGGDAGTGAAIGAGVGGLFGMMRRHRYMEEEQQTQQEQMRQQQGYMSQEQNALARGRGNYNRAFSACMTARGYTVN